jgi:hypothetical protein
MEITEASPAGAPGTGRRRVSRLAVAGASALVATITATTALGVTPARADTTPSNPIQSLVAAQNDLTTATNEVSQIQAALSQAQTQLAAAQAAESRNPLLAPAYALQVAALTVTVNAQASALNAAEAQVNAALAEMRQAGLTPKSPTAQKTALQTGQQAESTLDAAFAKNMSAQEALENNEPEQSTELLKAVDGLLQQVIGLLADINAANAQTLSSISGISA